MTMTVSPSAQAQPGQFNVGDQELINHAVNTTERLMNREVHSPTLYNRLVEDPHVVQPGGKSSETICLSCLIVWQVIKFWSLVLP